MGFLTILTLGIYRFWAKTKVRQYYWENIEVAGDTLEYHGRPIELLIGFLIAIVVLLPFGLVFTGTVTLFPGAEIATAVIFVWLVSYAFFRARRYKVSRTSWRGIRGGQTGSAVRYAFLRLASLAAGTLSLGFAYPWFRTMVHRYTIRNTYLGNTAFTFHGSPTKLFMPWIPVQLAIVAAIALVVFNFQELAGSMEISRDASGKLQIQSNSPVAGVIALVAFLGIAFLIRFRVAEARFIANNARLLDAHATLALSSRTVFWRLFLAGLVYLILTIIVVALVFAVVFALVAAGADALRVTEQATADGLEINYGLNSTIANIVFAVFLLIMLSVVQHVLFWLPVVRRLTEKLEIENLASIEQVAQSARADPRFGEGLADALSFDALPI